MHQPSMATKNARRRARYYRQRGDRDLSVEDFDALINPDGRLNDTMRSDTIRKRCCDVHVDMHGQTTMSCVAALRRNLRNIDTTDDSRNPVVGVITGRGLHSKGGVRVIHDPVGSFLHGRGFEPHEVVDGFVFTLTNACYQCI